jgi:uncharacterized membrane protein YhaH (DUF805 family)
MNIVSALFSFDGRLRRLHFWLFAIALAIANSIVGSLTFFPAIMAAAASGDPEQIVVAYGSPGSLIFWAWWLVMLWPSLALDIKRLHDRNRSGWFLFIVLIPIIGVLWLLIELLFLDGTPGPNRFGPSPKGLGGPAPMEGAVA